MVDHLLIEFENMHFAYNSMKFNDRNAMNIETDEQTIHRIWMEMQKEKIKFHWRVSIECAHRAHLFHRHSTNEVHAACRMTDQETHTNLKCFHFSCVNLNLIKPYVVEARQRWKFKNISILSEWFWDANITTISWRKNGWILFLLWVKKFNKWLLTAAFMNPYSVRNVWHLVQLYSGIICIYAIWYLPSTKRTTHSAIVIYMDMKWIRAMDNGICIHFASCVRKMHNL